MTRWVCTCTIWSIAFLLLLGNFLLLLPPRMTFAQFLAVSMAPPRLELRLDETVPRSLVLIAENGVVLDYRGPQIVPVPSIQNWIDERRIAHLREIAFISLYIRPEAGEEWLKTRSPAERYRSPDNGRTLRWVFAGARRGMMPGRYEARAVLHAEPMWTTPAPGADRTRLRQAVWPGQFLLGSVSTEPVAFTVDQTLEDLRREIEQQIRTATPNDSTADGAK